MQDKFYIRALVSFIFLSGLDFSFIKRIGWELSWFPSEPAKLLSLIFLISYISSPKIILQYIFSNSVFAAWVFWIAIVLSCSLLYSGTLDLYVPYSNAFRTLEQIIGLSIGISMGYYARLVYLKTPDVLYKSIHLSMLPVCIGIVIQIGYMGVGDVFSDRLYGFSGEPKWLAIFLVPYLIALLASNTNQNIFGFIVTLALLFCILLTKSSTGFIALGLSITVWLFNSRKNFHKYSRKIIFMLILISIFFNVYDEYYTMIVERIADALGGTISIGVHEIIELPILGFVRVEANEYPILEFLTNYPILILTGVGLGQESIISHQYLSNAGSIGFLDSTYSGYITPNSALLASISNFGFIFVIILILSVFKRLHAEVNESGRNRQFVYWYFFSHFLIGILVIKTQIPFSFTLSFLLGSMVVKKTFKYAYKQYA